MKLVKFVGHGQVSGTFDCDRILLGSRYSKKVGNGVIGQNEDSVFHFHSNGKHYSVCSNVSMNWSKSECNTIISNTLKQRCYLRTSYVLFESFIDLGTGGPELFHWNLNKYPQPMVLSNVYEPEIYEAQIIMFEETNSVQIDAHIFLNGRLLIKGSPMNQHVSIEQIRNESCSRLKHLHTFLEL